MFLNHFCVLSNSPLNVFRIMAVLLLVVGTISHEFFQSDVEKTGECAFINERKKCVHPFVFHRTRENTNSPLYWDPVSRKATMNSLETMLLNEIFIVKFGAPVQHIQSLIVRNGPILEFLPKIHKETCLTEKQLQRKSGIPIKQSRYTEYTESPEKVRRAFDRSQVN